MLRSLAPVLIALSTGGWRATAQTSHPTAYTETPTPLCTLQDRSIDEASGIVPSHRNPGCYYVHNDSGDRPRVFLVDRTGRTRLTIRLKNAQSLDYEDIALAPGAQPGTFDVCLADIGDNRRERPHVTIYRFPEVDLKQHGAGKIDVEPVAYRARYADGPANAEAFCVHPQTGHGYIFTKRTDGHTAVFKIPAPWDRDHVMVLSRLLTLEFAPAASLSRIATAADIAPDGRRLAVRCYIDGYEWRLPGQAGDADFERIFQTRPLRLSLAAEPQAEALCYAADGAAILTISEGPSPTLYESRATAPTDRSPP